MTPVQSLAFAGHEIAVVGGAIGGNAEESWRLVAWVSADDSTLPADGWVQAQTDTGRFVAWGTLIDKTAAEADSPGRYRFTFVDAVAPIDAAAPTAGRGHSAS
jgi:hypothetical protein